MLCRTCGFDNRPESHFCIKCGNSFDVCRTCGFNNLPESHFCSKCGKSFDEVTAGDGVLEDGPEAVEQVLTCQVCYFDNRPESRFCIKCGKSFYEVTAGDGVLEGNPEAVEILSKSTVTLQAESVSLSSKINWGLLWSALFSEKTMSAVLSFGVLLIAISSLVIVVGLWSKFDWWQIQLFFLLQMLAFIAAGHMVKEHLKLHISGLALISIGAIWTLFSTGVFVYEFIGSAGEITIPGVGLPIDLPVYGWLIISGVSVPVWAVLTYRYRGHVLMQGTVALAGGSICLMVASVGTGWQWSVFTLTVFTSVMLVVWKRLIETSYRGIAKPLFWSLQVAALISTLALLDFNGLLFYSESDSPFLSTIPSLVTGDQGYQFAASVFALAIFYAIAFRFTGGFWYRYPTTALPAVALISALGKLDIVDTQYFDVVIVIIAAIYLVCGSVLNVFRVSGLENSWKVLHPLNIVSVSLIVLAMLWPEVNDWSRSISMAVAGMLTVVMAFMWKREPWLWVPFVPISASAVFCAEAANIGDGFLVLFVGALGFLGLLAGYILRKFHRFAVPPFVWSVVLSATSILLALSSSEPWVNAYNFSFITILLICQSVIVFKASPEVFSLALRIVAFVKESNRISVRDTCPHHISVWVSGFLGTLALGLLHIVIAEILSGFGATEIIEATSAFAAIAWSIAVVMLSGYLLVRVSFVHKWGGFIVGGVSAFVGLILGLELIGQYGFALVCCGLVVLTSMYRIITRWTFFSWLVTVFAGISAVSILELTGFVTDDYWGFVLGIIAIVYLVVSALLGGKEKDGYGPLAASVFFIAVSLAWSGLSFFNGLNPGVDASEIFLDSALASLGFAIAAIYFVALALNTWTDRFICKPCSVEYKDKNNFCTNCGKSLSCIGRWIPLTFVDGNGFPYLSSVFTILGGTLLAISFMSSLIALDVARYIQSYALILWATVFFVLSVVLRKWSVPSARLTPFHVLSGLVGLLAVLILLEEGTSIALTITLTYGAVLAMAFRLHFRNQFPLYAGSLLLAGALIEALLDVNVGYLGSSVICSIFAIGAVGIGFISDKVSFKDSVPSYAFGVLAIFIGEFYAWGNPDAQILVLGSLTVMSVFMAFWCHTGNLKGLIWAASAIFGKPVEKCTLYVTTSFIALATITLPIWSVQALNLLSIRYEFVGIILATHSLVLFFAGGQLIRAQKMYAVPLQAVGVTTAILGPLLAMGIGTNGSTGMLPLTVTWTSDAEYFRSASLWVSSIAFGVSSMVYRRWYWTYPTLALTHLAIASTLYMSGLDIHKNGLVLAVFSLCVTGAFGFASMRLKRSTEPMIGGLDYRIVPLALFALTDIIASLILGGWDDWSNWEGLLLSCAYMFGSIILALLTRSKYIPYASTLFLAVSISFLAGMVGNGWSARAVGWAAQGLILWWVGRGIEQISKKKGHKWVSLWQQPLLTSGIRLTWFASGFVAIVVCWSIMSVGGLSEHVDNATAVMAIVVLLYLGMALYYRRSIFAYVSAVALIMSWYLQLADRDIMHAQFYAIPAGIYLLGLSFFETRRTDKDNLLPAVVNVIGVLVLAGSAFVQSILHGPELLYALIVGIEGVLLVFWGAVSKSKVPFIGGIIAFTVNVLYQATSMLSMINVAIGVLVIGLFLVIMVILLERFRNRLMKVGHSWDWTW